MSNGNQRDSVVNKLPGTLVLLVFFVALDQLTKYLAVRYLSGNRDILLIPEVFHLHYLENRGAAFGILQNHSWVFLLASLLILLCGIYVFVRMPHTGYYRPLHFLGIVLVAGGLGNTIDRLFRGYVVDFLYFVLIDFPVFNVADIYVVVSCILICILIMTVYREESFEFLNPGKQGEQTWKS